jgi:hypothetical protein
VGAHAFTVSAQCGEHRLFHTVTAFSRSPLNAAHHTSLQCLNLPTETQRGGTTQVCVTRRSHLSLLISQIITDGHLDYPQSTPNQPLQGESNFGDSSGPLFSIYSKAAEDEDNKMVGRWQEDATGVLIFVSPRVGIHAALCINWNTIDRSVLCCRGCTPRCDSPGPEANKSGYLCILSWEHL